jgi:hypothetical protein
MHKKSLLLLISIFFMGCLENEVIPEVDLTGEYHIDVQLSDFVVEHDSMGNFINAGTVSHGLLDTIEIAPFENTVDSFLFLLPISYNHSQLLIGQKQGDTLVVDEDYSVSGYTINYKRGKIWMEGDSLYINYSWRNEYISHPGAFPNFGSTIGVGYLIN